MLVNVGDSVVIVKQGLCLLCSCKDFTSVHASDPSKYQRCNKH